MLNGQIPDSTITRTQNHATTFNYSENDSLNEKFNQMGFTTDLKASFLAGWVDVKGSGWYISAACDSTRVMQGSMHYRITTEHESLQLMNTALWDVLDFKNINSGLATHVVAEITWGAHTVVTAQHQLLKYENQNEADIRGALKAYLGLLELGQVDPGSHPKFDINIYSDVLPDGGEISTTLERAFSFIATVPHYISNTNGGIGKPLSYTLLPLDMFAYIFPTQITTNIPLVQVSMDTLEKFVQLLDSFNHAQIAIGTL